MATITKALWNESKFPEVKTSDVSGKPLKRFYIEGVVYATSKKEALASVREDVCLTAAQLLNVG